MASALYDRIGAGYSGPRHPDPRIEAMIAAQFEGAGSLVNVGAGAGSYEPADIPVIALELSSTMIKQRPKTAAPCVQGRAEALPFKDDSFDVATAFLTYHHWSDVFAGLAEMRRVARGRIIILTWDPDSADTLWISRDYLPENIEFDRAIFPPLAEIAGVLGPSTISPVPIPHDCTDGFLGAYWRRPHLYLDKRAQKGISTFRRLPKAVIERGMEALREDLATGAWDEKHGALLELESLDLGYRLIVANP